MTSSSPQLKHDARRRAVAQRAALAAEPLAASSHVALAHVWRHWLLAHPCVRHVAGYAAIRSELDCTLALRQARQLGCLTYYPCVRPDDTIEMIGVYDEFQHLYPSRWGLREPRGQGVALDVLDVILVPGLRFDRHGGRLGYGKGHYDRLMARLACTSRPPLLFGVCDSRMLWATPLPTEPHDRRVDGVVTPDGIISFI